MATLNELKERAEFVISHGKDEKDNIIQSVYSKASFGLNYMGDCVVTPKGYKFNGNVYKTVDELFGSFKDWHKSLDLPSRFYDPLYNEDYRLEATIVWYLTDVLGFKNDAFKNYIYTLTFGVTELKIYVEPGVKLYLTYFFKDYQYSIPVKDYKEGFNFINTYVTMVFAETVPMRNHLIGKLICYNDAKMPKIEAIDYRNVLKPDCVDGNKMILARLKELVKQLEDDLNDNDEDKTIIQNH